MKVLSIHSVHQSEGAGGILKLDYEKAYDKVNREFLLEILSKRNFGDRWIGWIKQHLYNGSVGVQVNEKEGNFFETGKGLRQGDPLSPILFNLVVDVLTRMFQKAQDHELIKGLGCELIPQGVISLQYADDTILFLSDNVKKARNMKYILACFENISGMRINYTKSEIIPLNLGDQVKLSLVEIFGCPVGPFPIKYLGIPLHFEKLKREDLQPLVDKIVKRIAGWRGKLLSYAGRLVLIKTCLASIPIYLMSFFKFPNWALDLINSLMAHCLWNNFEEHGKLHLANWKLVNMKKDYGGLGVPDLKDLNLVMLGSWVKRFILDEGKLWHQIMGTYQVQTNLFMQTMKTSIWAIRSTSKGRGAKRWEGEFVKV